MYGNLLRITPLLNISKPDLTAGNVLRLGNCKLAC